MSFEARMILEMLEETSNEVIRLSGPVETYMGVDEEGNSYRIKPRMGLEPSFQAGPPEHWIVIVDAVYVYGKVEPLEGAISVAHFSNGGSPYWVIRLENGDELKSSTICRAEA